MVNPSFHGLFVNSCHFRMPPAVSFQAIAIMETAEPWFWQAHLSLLPIPMIGTGPSALACCSTWHDIMHLYFLCREEEGCCHCALCHPAKPVN